MVGNSQGLWIAIALLPVAVGVLCGRWQLALVFGALAGLLHPMPFYLHQEAIQPINLVLKISSEIQDVMIRQRFGRHALAAILGAGGALASFHFLRPFLLKLRK